MSVQTLYLQGIMPSRVRLNPLSIFTSTWKNRELVYRLARREVETRYRGSMLGLIWSFLVPLMMLGVYTFVFTKIFHPRFELPAGRNAPFFIILFAGMICLNLFCECIGRAPGLMLGNVTLIKKVIFPLEILPVQLQSRTNSKVVLVNRIAGGALLPSIADKRLKLLLSDRL